MKKGVLICTLLMAVFLTTGIASAHVYWSFSFPPFGFAFGGPAVVAPPPAYYPYPYGYYSYPYTYGYYGYRVWVPGYWGYGRGGRAWMPGHWRYRR